MNEILLHYDVTTWEKPGRRHAGYVSDHLAASKKSCNVIASKFFVKTDNNSNFTIHYNIVEEPEWYASRDTVNSSK